MKKINTDAACATPIEQIIPKYVPDLKQKGNELRGLCPFHNEKTPSFSVNINDQLYYCFGCGAGGDVVNFVMEHQRLDFLAACAAITGDAPPVEGPIPAPSVRPDPFDKYILESCPDIPVAGRSLDVTYPKRDHQRGTMTPDAVYPYYDEYGDLHGIVIRINMSGGKKMTPPLRWAGYEDGWITCSLGDKDRPAYAPPCGNAPKNQAIIVEGEKAADALGALLRGRVAAFSWSGGTKAVEKTDWSFLVNRKVFLIPDNDPGGEQAMEILAGILQLQAGRTEHVMLRKDTDRPKGWDVADENWASPSVFANWLRAGLEPALPDVKDSKPAVVEEVETLPAVIEQEPEPANPMDERILTVTPEMLLPTSIKGRGEVFGPMLAIGDMTLLGGPGGVGKSLFALQVAVCLALGRDFTGMCNGPDEFIAPRRVLVVNLEDKADEMMMRLQGILKEYKMGADRMNDRLHVYPGIQWGGMKLAGDEQQVVTQGRDLASLEAYIVANKIEVIMADPFVGLHDSNENDNGTMNDVMAILRRITVEHELAFMLLHHTRKGSNARTDTPGEEEFRGASAIKDLCRRTYLMMPMQDILYKKCNNQIDQKDRRRFTQLISGKMNYSLSLGVGNWFRKESVEVEVTDYFSGKPAKEWVGVAMPVDIDDYKNDPEDDADKEKSEEEIMWVLHDLIESSGYDSIKLGDYEKVLCKKLSTDPGKPVSFRWVKKAIGFLPADGQKMTKYVVNENGNKTFLVREKSHDRAPIFIAKYTDEEPETPF